METREKCFAVIYYIVLYVVVVGGMYIFYDWLDNTVDKECVLSPEMYSTMNKCHYASHNSFNRENSF